MPAKRRGEGNKTALLRSYFVQQYEAGDRELILSERHANSLGGEPAATDATPPADWRDALRAAGAAPVPAKPIAPADATRVERVRTPAPAAPSAGRAAPGGKPAWHTGFSLDEIPRGLTVGSSSHELFEGSRDGYASIVELERAIAVCKRCSLYRGAKNPVPGEGDPNADLMCVGEAPGATEDELGRPFVGQAGKLLTQILAAIELPREKVYICNVLKHRPPNNRNPLPDEVTACQPYLVRQVELVRPKVILALGTFAAQTLLETKSPMGRLREAMHFYHGIPLVVTYHPAALLRNPSWKRPTWEDVQLARRLFDRVLPDLRQRGT